MSKISQQELFQRIAEQFGGFRFSDDELRLKRFHAGDPRGDPRYKSGPPPAGVDLIGFEYLYEVPEVRQKIREELPCMFGNHRHFSGAAFLFSDGAVRCVGRNCFAELAVHTGKDVGLIRSAVRHLTERQGYLSWFDRATGQIEGLAARIRDPNFVDRCSRHDRFFDVLRRSNAPASRYAAKIAADHGRVVQYRTFTIKKAVKRETHIVQLRDWEAFRGVILAERHRCELSQEISSFTSELSTDTRDLTSGDFKRLRQKLEWIAEAVADLDKRLKLLASFCQGDGIAHFVELWNAQASAGFELQLVGDKLVSGSETLPTEIPLAA